MLNSRLEQVGTFSVQLPVDKQIDVLLPVNTKPSSQTYAASSSTNQLVLVRCVRMYAPLRGGSRCVQTPKKNQYFE